MFIYAARHAGAVFRTPSINIYTRNLNHLIEFYESVGFRQTFRTPKLGEPDHVELKLDQFTMGIATVKAAVSYHSLNPNLGGRPFEIVLWSDDTDRAFACLTARGAPSLSPPHDFLGVLRAAWVADPDGNPIQLVQHR
jgi:predicted enzyme related to lactoylglutathione lyase